MRRMTGASCLSGHPFLVTDKHRRRHHHQEEEEAAIKDFFHYCCSYRELTLCISKKGNRKSTVRRLGDDSVMLAVSLVRILLAMIMVTATLNPVRFGALAAVASLEKTQNNHQNHHQNHHHHHHHHQRRQRPNRGDPLVDDGLRQFGRPGARLPSRNHQHGDNRTATSTTSSTMMAHLRNETSEYTGWSGWSVCDRYCTQNRVKRCRVRKKCGNAVIREERDCRHHRSLNCRGHNQRRATRRRGGRFNIVHIPEEVKPRRRGGRKKDRDSGSWRTNVYGKWSKWSRCTKSCTTQRLRWCEVPGFCKKEVIRESAYCYIEGTYCQKWIRRKIRDNSDDLLSDKNDLNMNGIESVPLGNHNTNHNHEEENWKCGVSKRDTRLSYFTRIIGGRPAIPGAWPWQVAVLNRHGEAFCGGTLVSDKWVLTAAHCVRKRLSVRIGEYNLMLAEGHEIELRVAYSVIHPKYNVHTVDNDIALLRLPTSVAPSDTVEIACLPEAWQELPADQLCTIIGWGKANASHEYGTDVLHEARIPIVSDEMCRNVYVDYKITGNMFCAGYRRGRMDSCAGDSGGPLLCRDPKKPDHPWTIFGITSFGEGCGKRGKYGIYARLSNYVHWIAKVMKQADSF